MKRRHRYLDRVLKLVAVLLVASGSMSFSEESFAEAQDSDDAKILFPNAELTTKVTDLANANQVSPFAIPLSEEYPSEPLAVESVDTGVVEASYQKSSGPKAASSYPTVQLHGFFQADAGWFGQDAVNMASIAAINGVASGDLQDGVNFRRARLSPVGT